MIVGIHQPNYLPWLGYFAKIARSDVFVFLDDVQFSKGSYTNRVKVASADTEAWLTVPVTVALGMEIRAVARARSDIGLSHADRLKGLYGRAAHFREIFPWISPALCEAEGGLSESNQALVRVIATRLGLRARFLRSSDLGVRETDPSERLARLVASLAPGGTYLAGKGASGYQDDAAFSRHGLGLARLGFTPPTYPRGEGTPIAGLSVVDALFHVGVAETARLVQSGNL